MIDLTNIWLAWSLPGPWRFRRVATGSNNLVWYAETPSGDTYVLKLHQNSRKLQLHYEAAVTQALQQASLSFVTPTPILTSAGEIGLEISTESGTMLVTLWPFVEGVHPKRDDIRQARAAGAALAELQAALQKIPSGALPGDYSPARYGDLQQIHPQIPDPHQAVQELAIDAARKRELLRLLESLAGRLPDLYRLLPQQLIHGDYVPSNILMAADRVTGVLDFEVATFDVRLMDLVVACSWWSFFLLETNQEWPVIEALGRGYTGRRGLRPAEISAFPDLFRLRAATSLIHRLGRREAGLETAGAIEERVDDTLRWDRWLASRRQKLIDYAQEWSVSRWNLKEKQL